MTIPIHADKKLRFYLATAFISLLIFLFLGEVLVRLFLPFNNPDTIRRYSLQHIPSLFSRSLLKPVGQIVEDDSDKASGKTGQDEVPTHGVFINNVGYRGHNFPPRKPEGITRIVIVGGSAVFDGNANDLSADGGQDWPHLVERLLRRMGYNSVEVINAGIPGNASFDVLGRLYSQIWLYEPDYVLFYEAWNDIKYFKKVTPENPLISLYKPRYPNSNPFTDYQGPWDRFLSNSQLYVKFRNQYYSRKYRVGKEGIIPEEEDQDTYSPYAVKQYRLNVALIVDACRNIGATPILVTQATLVSANNSSEERKLIGYEYQRLSHSALLKAFNEAYQVIRLVAQEKRAAVLDLAKELNGKRDLFIDHVHLTTKGSEEVAKRVADFLASDLKVRSTSKKDEIVSR